MLHVIILACVLAVMMPILPAAGQPNGVLTQANAKALVEKYHCYSMSIAAAQTVLLEKWFKSIGATDQEFTNFQVNAERARRLACGETPSNFAPSPMSAITARFQTNHRLSDVEARLTLLDSLAKYAKLLAATCDLPTEKDLALSLFAQMRSLSGGPSPRPPSFDPSNTSAYLGSCGRGGRGQVPNVGDDIGSWGNTAKDRYRQCVRDVIAKAKPAECVKNPRASETWNNVKYGATFLAGLVAVATAGPAAPVVAVAAAVALLAEIQSDAEAAAAAAEAAEQRRKDQENIKKLEEQIAEMKRKEEAAATASTTPTTPSTTPSDTDSGSETPTPQPAPTPEATPTPAPDPKKQCNRFPVAGTGYELSYVREDGGVIGLLDSVRTCRCEARAAEGLGGSAIAGQIGSECQSDADRRRAECARNPFDDVDRPREECIALLLQDNSASLNIETLLCSQVQCTQYSRKVGISANRVLACGCLGPGLSREGSTRTTSCDQMMCDGECVCRDRSCTCEGSETREPPPTPPSPPVRPAIPEGPGGIPAPPFR